MRRFISLTLFFLLFAIIIGSFFWYRESRSINEGMVESAAVTLNQNKASIPPEQPPAAAVLPQPHFIAQSFNNCGPASLSMVMSMYGKQVDQETLANRMRPFHNPDGGIDDKSVFAPEFVVSAKEYGFEALERPNGTIDLIKKFIANGIPVVVRTWLHPGEDIGHFRIVRGYNAAEQKIIQDDSFEGPDISYTYDEFLSMWQPFNYGYILIYPKEKEAVVRSILGDEIIPKAAYEKSIVRATREREENPSAVYPSFNISTAQYHLGKYKDAVESYEKVASQLPPRMLWYQIEPILAYHKTGKYDEVYRLTDHILNNGNMAFSELYQIRGEVFLKAGKKDEAKTEFEKAVYYNVNFQPAKEALRQL
jgi:hypothetical protein